MAGEEQLHIDVVGSESLSQTDREAVVDLCNRAYEEDLRSLFNTFREATHILGTYNRKLVSHAMWVTRWLQAGTGPVLRTAYVEMVATDKAYRMRGFAAAVMRRLVCEIQDFDLGALSPFSVAYYERLGCFGAARFLSEPGSSTCGRPETAT